MDQKICDKNILAKTDTSSSVAGGIACYKACELTRELGRRGALVQIVMTEALRIRRPLTFQALTNREFVFLYLIKAEAGMSHINYPLGWSNSNRPLHR